MMMKTKKYRVKIDEVKGPKVDLVYISKGGDKVISYARNPLIRKQVIKIYDMTEHTQVSTPPGAGSGIDMGTESESDSTELL